MKVLMVFGVILVTSTIQVALDRSLKVKLEGPWEGRVLSIAARTLWGVLMALILFT